MAGIQFNPGLKAAGIDPALIKSLIETQKIPVNQAKRRKKETELEKQEIDKLSKMLDEFDAAAKVSKHDMIFTNSS